MGNLVNWRYHRALGVSLSDENLQLCHLATLADNVLIILLSTTRLQLITYLPHLFINTCVLRTYNCVLRLGNGALRLGNCVLCNLLFP